MLLPIGTPYPQCIYYHGPLDNNKGGVAVYIKKDVYVQERFDLTLCHNPRLDNLWLEIIKDGVSFVIGNMYRHPNYNTHVISDLIGSNLSIIKQEGKICIICGDVNIDLLQQDSCQTKIYMDTLIRENMLPCITLPTRITDHSATLKTINQGIMEDICGTCE